MEQAVVKQKERQQGRGRKNGNIRGKGKGRRETEEDERLSNLCLQDTVRNNKIIYTMNMQFDNLSAKSQC